MLKFNLVVDLLDGTVPLNKTPEKQIKKLLGITKTKDYKSFIKKAANLTGKYPINEEFKNFLKSELEKQKLEVEGEVLKLETEYISKLSFESDTKELIHAKFSQFEKLNSIVSSFVEEKPKTIKVELTKILGGTEVAQDTATDFLSVCSNGLQLAKASPEKKSIFEKRLITSVNKYLTGSNEVTTSSAPYVFEMINNCVLKPFNISIPFEQIESLQINDSTEIATELTLEKEAALSKIQIPDSIDTKDFVSSVRSNLTLFRTLQEQKYSLKSAADVASQKEALSKIITKTIQDIGVLTKQIEVLANQRPINFREDALARYNSRAGSKVDETSPEFLKFLDCYKSSAISSYFASDRYSYAIERCAFNAFIFFDGDVEQINSFLQTAYKSVKNPYHQAFDCIMPNLNAQDNVIVLDVWREFVKQNSANPVAIKSLIANFFQVVKLQNQLGIEPQNSEVVTISVEQLSSAIGAINYYQKTQINPELARIYQKYSISELIFDETLWVMNSRKLKQEDTLPNVTIDVAEVIGAEKGKNLYFVKLPAGDYRGFILGKITGCCQSITGASQKVVIDGMTRQNNGFYVLIEAKQHQFDPSNIDWQNFEENGNQILGQGYIWRATDDSLVFDSWENKSVQHNSIILPILRKFGELSGVDRVTIGTGGKTPVEIKISSPAAVPSMMIEGEDYVDAKVQHEVFVSPELQAARDFVTQVFDLKDAKKFMYAKPIFFLQEHIDCILQQFENYSSVKNKQVIFQQIYTASIICLKQQIVDTTVVEKVVQKIIQLDSVLDGMNNFSLALQQAFEQNSNIDKLNIIINIDSEFFKLFGNKALDILEILLACEDISKMEVITKIDVEFFKSFGNKALDILEILLICEDINKIDAIAKINPDFFQIFKNYNVNALEALLACDNASKIEVVAKINQDFFQIFKNYGIDVLKILLACNDIEKIKVAANINPDFFQSINSGFFDASENNLNVLKILIACNNTTIIDAVSKINLGFFQSFKNCKINAMIALLECDEAVKVDAASKINPDFFDVFGYKKIDVLKILLACDNVEKISAVVDIDTGFFQAFEDSISMLRLLLSCDESKIKDIGKIYSDFSYLSSNDESDSDNYPDFDSYDNDGENLANSYLLQYNSDHLSQQSSDDEEDIDRLSQQSSDDEEYSFHLSQQSSDDEEDIDRLSQQSSDDEDDLSPISKINYPAFGKYYLEALRALLKCGDESKIDAITKFPFHDCSSKNALKILQVLMREEITINNGVLCLRDGVELWQLGYIDSYSEEILSDFLSATDQISGQAEAFIDLSGNFTNAADSDFVM
jgi:hypothetical protein